MSLPLTQRIMFSLGFLAASAGAADNCDEALREIERGAKHVDGSRDEEEAFRHAAELCPKMADAHYNLGVSLTKQKRLDEAAQALDRAIELGKDADYLVARANVAAEKGDSALGAQLYEKALAGEPHNARALQGVAALYAERGELQRAEESLRQAIQVEPRDPRLFHGLGVVLERLKRLDEAAVSYQTSIDRQSSFIPGYLGLASVSLKSGKVAAAEKTLRSAAVLDPANREVAFLLATCYEQQGRFDRALTTLEPVRDESVSYLRRTGILFVKDGRAEEGIDRLRNALDRDPRSGPTLGALGWAFLSRKDLEQAEKYLREALAAAENDPFAHNNLGVLLELKGMKEEAQREFQRAKDLGGSLPESRGKRGE